MHSWNAQPSSLPILPACTTHAACTMPTHLPGSSSSQTMDRRRRLMNTGLLMLCTVGRSTL